MESVPWQVLEFAKAKRGQDNQELSLSSQQQAKQELLAAKKSERLPDLTIGLGFTKRSAVANNGDQITFSVAMHIPLSNSRNSEIRKVKSEDDYLRFKLVDYRRRKRSLLNTLELENRKLERESSVLILESINFARNARQITAESYRLGAESYVALLQSELKLQQLLLKAVELKAMNRLNSLEYKFLLGDKLHE